MKRILAIASFSCAIAVSSAKAQPFCFKPPPSPQCSAGDPVGVVYGNVINRLVDITLPTTLGPFELVRYFDSDIGHWQSTFNTPLDNVTETPEPFAGSNESSQ
jgi:hypothetical protein